mmetsp:Transcript_33262/g.79715  ORF Transcript_33262/g.79715 Transcript_33262/m.79715 type:complete len:265 (+) Transcript_33262:1078-1872(+)
MEALVSSSSCRTAPSNLAACSPHAKARRCASADCSTVAETAVRATATRRAAASMAARPPRVTVEVGNRSSSFPRSKDTFSPSSTVPSVLSSHSCQDFKDSATRCSAKRPFCCRTWSSSRARVSFSSCQYSLRTSSSPTDCSSQRLLSSWRCFRKKALRASSVSGSWVSSGKAWPLFRVCSRWEAIPRSSSARDPQVVCCTASQALRTLSCLPSFRHSTSCFSSAAKEAELMACPATVFGCRWQVAKSWAWIASTPPRNSLRKDR